MTRRFSAALCSLLLILTAHAQPTSYPKTAPPPPPAEIIPPIPPTHPNWVWRAGHYRWRNGQYLWAAGAYADPPHAGYRWTPGRWKETSMGWVWVDGRWH